VSTFTIRSTDKPFPSDSPETHCSRCRLQSKIVARAEWHPPNAKLEFRYCLECSKT
jgi:hypothetical protein